MIRRDPVSRASALVLLSGLLVVLLAAALRFHRLDDQSFWNDEGSSYVQSLRSLPEIAANAARDIHPPGYYALLAGWRLLAGETEFALRSLSVCASLLTAACVFAIGRRLFNLTAGILAALIVALNSFSLHYAQEARMYAPLAAWSALGLWLILGTTRRSAAWIIALGLVNAAGLYTHYAYPFVMLVQAVLILLDAIRAGRIRWRTLLAFALANGLALILFAPWLPTALRQVTQWPSTGQPIPPLEAIGIIAEWFTFGITYPAIPNAVPYLPLALLLLSGGWIGWIGLRGRGMLRRLAAPLIWALLPVALFLLLGLFRPANLKFLLPSQLGFALWIGAGIGGWWALARRGLRVERVTVAFTLLQTVWLLAYLVNALAPLYDDPRFRRADYRAMAALLTAQAGLNDAIILNAPNQEEVFRYYYRASTPIYPLPAGLGGDDADTTAAVREIIARSRQIYVLYWGEAERDPNRVVEATLDRESFEVGQDVWYGDVRLARYAAPEPLDESRPVYARFGASIWLERYALNRRTYAPGDVIQAQLEWRTDVPLTVRYKVFVQLLNPDGILVAQRDAEPVGNLLPTTAWTPGETIIDPHGLALSPDLPAGRYALILGLYNIDDPADRLTVFGRSYYPVALVEVVTKPQ
jgi:uncharacterized membrane protein